MGHDQRAEAARIGQRARENLAVLNHPVAIGKGHSPGIAQKSDLRHLAARAPFGKGRHRMHMHRAGLAGTAAHEFEGFGIVDGRIGVGARDNCGDPARSRRSPRAAIAFLVPLARLADLHTHIYDARREVFTATIDHARGTALRQIALKHMSDLALCHQ